MRRSVGALSQLVVALGVAHSVAAQGAPLTRGDRVRLTVPAFGDSRFVGTVERARADTIHVRTRVGVLTAVPLDQVTRLEFSRGVRRPTWSRTAPLWMPLAGAGAAAWGGWAMPASRTSRQDSAEFMAIVGGFVGLLVGTGIAIAVGPQDVWATLPNASGSGTSFAPSLFITPATTRLTFGLRAPF